jgi:hypothetical protein
MSSTRFFEHRPSSPSYSELDDPLHPQSKKRRKEPMMSFKLLYCVIGALVLTVWTLAFVILSERGWLEKLGVGGKGKGKGYWSQDIIPKGT